MAVDCMHHNPTIQNLASAAWQVSGVGNAQIELEGHQETTLQHGDPDQAVVGAKVTP